MNYIDERDKLRREAESETNAAKARIENQEKKRADQKETLKQYKTDLVSQDVRSKKIEIARAENNIVGMARKERIARKELGIKPSNKKRSEMTRVKKEAGTLHKKGREEMRLEHLKKQLGSLKEISDQNKPTLRPPGGGRLY